MALQPPPRVLVIDDEKGLRDMLSYAFRRMKFETFVAAGGEEGVAAALAGDFDAVVCDVMMPGLDGFGVLERLRRERPNLPVVMVTGYPSDESAARSRGLGAFEYLAKPYDIVALGACLEKAAALKRAARP